MSFTTVVPWILKWLTLLSHVFLLILLVLAVTGRYRAFSRRFTRYALPLALLVAVVATSGSLFYSEVLGYEPCRLCWFQRIFVYPQVILLAVAWWRRHDVRMYSYPMLAIGGLIATYHYTIQMMARAQPVISDSCSASGAVSCVSTQFLSFKYITIPLMSLTACVLIFLFLTWQHVRKK